MVDKRGIVTIRMNESQREFVKDGWLAYKDMNKVDCSLSQFICRAARLEAEKNIKKNANHIFLQRQIQANPSTQVNQ